MAVDLGPRDAEPAPPDEGPLCVPFRAVAPPARLELLILADSSGSMRLFVDATQSRWEAVTEALNAFFEDEASTDVAASLTFFPRATRDDLPLNCESDSDCGLGPGACQITDLCTGNAALCRDEGDCPAGEECLDLGFCEFATRPDDLCLRSSNCSLTEFCVERGFCSAPEDCQGETYFSPDVERQELPGGAPVLLQALESRSITGGTPTLPAVEGAVMSARARLRASPRSRVAIFLATDGQPGTCDWWGSLQRRSETIADAAAVGAAEGIRTYVIGILPQNATDELRPAFQVIAQRGGSGEPIFVSTDSSTQERLREVLAELREELQSCTFAVPAPGAIPNPEDITVALLDGSGDAQPLARRADAEDCAGGGFYFDRPLSDGVRPGTIELCPASCALAEDPAVDVEISGTCPP